MSHIAVPDARMQAALSRMAQHKLIELEGRLAQAEHEADYPAMRRIEKSIVLATMKRLCEHSRVYISEFSSKGKRHMTFSCVDCKLATGISP